MAVRYTDMGLDTIGARDFVARQRTPAISQIIIIFTSVFLVCVSIVATAHDRMQLISTLFALFAIIGWYVIYQLMRARDMLLATEFQNALFASAMGLHNKFCLIIRRDGNIVYLDRSFQELFPDFTKLSNRSVDMLLKLGKVPPADSERIFNALDKGSYEKVIFDLIDGKGRPHHIVLAVEPILRPAGFIMLRGREFVEDRRGQAISSGKTPGLFSKSSVTLFAHVMESMKMGVYMASPTGNIIYCNPLLEQWLGYDEGEIVSRSLNISDLVPLGHNEMMTAEPANIENTVRMEKKVGGGLRVFLNQKIILNDAGKGMGCTALVHLYNEKSDTTPNAESKKNSF